MIDMRNYAIRYMFYCDDDGKFYCDEGKGKGDEGNEGGINYVLQYIIKV